MMTINDEIEEFVHAKKQLGVDDITAAILVLASATRNSGGTMDRTGAENLGHEFAMALKNVFEESQIKASVENYDLA